MPQSTSFPSATTKPGSGRRSVRSPSRVPSAQGDGQHRKWPSTLLLLKILAWLHPLESGGKTAMCPWRLQSGHPFNQVPGHLLGLPKYFLYIYCFFLDQMDPWKHSIWYAWKNQYLYVYVCEGRNNKWNHQPTHIKKNQKKQEGETKTAGCWMCLPGKSYFYLYLLMAAANRRSGSDLAKLRLRTRV